ncbi:MAG: HAD family hydrolase [Proteobacteria bacterium]|jgi:putative hydrolase of the HAD superfamily|nr:HAD family hydrolase [Pseudomonadota bacterium]
MKNIQCIGFDADDTLWQNECFYLDAERHFRSLLLDDASEDEISRIFFETETKNMDCLGYGAKAMTMSMIETAIAICPQISSDKIQKIIDIGKTLLEVPTVMLPGVMETFRALKKYRIVIITKGELNEQQRKFDHSPIDKEIPYFVLPDKKTSTYARLLARENIDPKTFLMIGNSPRSDVLPPLELGSWAAHVPFHTTWAHEDVELPEHPRLIQLNDIREIIRYLDI